MLDFLKNKKETETKVENEQNKAATAKELYNKFDETCNKILGKYPSLKYWVEFRTVGFKNMLYGNDIVLKQKAYMEYIDETLRLSDNMNRMVTENIEKWNEFCQDKSPRFVMVCAIPGFGNTAREYPEFYYATDFEVVDGIPEYYPHELAFYGTTGTDDGFRKIHVSPAWYTIRNMTRDEFVVFLGQKLSTTQLAPWEFDEFKQKWTKLYEDTTEPQSKNDKLLKGVRGEYGIIEHFHETKDN